MRNFLKLIPLLPVALAAASVGQNETGSQVPPAHPPALVQSALANELSAAQDESHPMRYRLHKATPRLATTKDLIETRDGSVAMLVAVNDQPLTSADLAKEQSRLQVLLTDPSRQRHRRQSEAEDTARALKVLRVLPNAFLYTDAGPATEGSLPVEKFSFTPNPRFNPPDLETQVLTQMAGEILVDPEHARVVRLEAKLQQDVDFGWGILGRLSKGGWIIIDQADVGEGAWRVVKFQMKMTGRLLIRTKTFDTIEEETDYRPVPADLRYQQAIAMLREGQPAIAGSPGR
ncbi:hypothetical protein DYQ86_03285 [Acidobacteria bacterium AB60]|nr:hypothetical protein DYQ86_03285 [Acidobacteria bacterium AB60]